MDISHYVVVPAYGRDYATLDDVKGDCQGNGLSVQIRFNKLADIYIWPESETSDDD